MLLYDGQSAHTFVARLFILERGGLSLSVQQIDIMNMENRRLKYRSEVNSRGEIPALKLDDGTILTETLAICRFLDETATAGKSLYGNTPLERAVTEMWLRRTDLEIVAPCHRWYRDDPATLDFYQGNRIPVPEARTAEKLTVNRGLNQLNDDLEDERPFLCGQNLSMADVWLYGHLKMMSYAPGTEWLNAPGRTKVAAWMDRMDQRQTSQRAMAVFGAKVEV